MVLKISISNILFLSTEFSEFIYLAVLNWNVAIPRPLNYPLILKTQLLSPIFLSKRVANCYKRPSIEVFLLITQ